MNRTDVEKYFRNILDKEKDVSAGIAAIRTLIEIIRNGQFGTIRELDEDLKTGRDVMRNLDYPATAIDSGCELFSRFITLASLDYQAIEECRSIMLDRAEFFLRKLGQTRGKIVKLFGQFIIDGCVILTHSRSRVVLQALKDAAKQKKQFHVYVTISDPDKSGEQMSKDLKAAGIESTLILDSAIAYIMEKIDFVMVGAEGVVESGGIINKIGSYTMALCAKTMNKPFYVLTESFKFTRLFPLNQTDLPEEYKYTANMRKKDLKGQHPQVDYTSPALITLLITDLGILTPSAVSDELMKLYL